MHFLFWCRAAGGALLVFLLAGCAGFSAAPLTAEQIVAARAQERWNVLVAGQLDKAYEYITPAGRSTLPISVFRGRLAGASWHDAKVTKVVCEPEICEVTVMLDIEVLPGMPHKQRFDEKWLLEGGKWWIVYRG